MMSTRRILTSNLQIGSFRHGLAGLELRIGKRCIDKQFKSGGLMNHDFARSIFSSASQSQMQTIDRKDTLNYNSTKFNESLMNRVRGSQEEKPPILTLANAIITSRALMAPALGYFIMNNMFGSALVCFSYAVASDVADKVAVRLYKRPSYLTCILDNFADRLVLLTSSICLFKLDIMSIHIIKALVIRDFLTIAGPGVMRYYGFLDRPTLKQYFDFDRNRTVCIRSTMISRLYTASAYGVVMTHLAFNHLTGDPTYDWAIFIGQGVCMLMASMSVSLHILTYGQSLFHCLPFLRAIK